MMDEETQKAILDLLQIIEDLKRELATQGLIKHEVGQSILGETLFEPIAHKGGMVVEAKTPEQIFAE